MVKISAELNVIISLDLTPDEAGALDAICGYGPDKFLEWFEKNLGKHYIAPYKKALPTLFEKARALEYQVKKAKALKEEIRLKLL